MAHYFINLLNHAHLKISSIYQHVIMGWVSSDRLPARALQRAGVHGFMQSAGFLETILMAHCGYYYVGVRTVNRPTPIFLNVGPLDPGSVTPRSA